MKKTYTRAVVALTSSLLIVGIAYAADAPSVTGQGQTLTQGIKDIGGAIELLTSSVVSRLITLFATAGMAAFFYGLVVFILATRNGDQTKITNGKQFMLWSMIALFVMFSIWGIVKYAQKIFGVTDNQIVIPQVIIGGSSASTAKTPVGFCPDGSAYYTADGAKYCGKSSAPAPGTVNPASTNPTGGAPSGGSAASSAPKAGQPCTTGGQSGHYVQGGASRDYALYCSPDATSSGSTGAPAAGKACTIDGKAGTYVQGGASRDYALYCSTGASSSSSSSNNGDTPYGYEAPDDQMNDVDDDDDEEDDEDDEDDEEEDVPYGYAPNGQMVV